MKLETKRLILREWNESDIDDLIEGLNNIEVSKWLTFVPYPYTKAEAKKWIQYCKNNSQKEDRNSYEFAIELKSEKKVIGGISLDSINKIQGTASGGIWLSANYHGKGYGTEAWGRRIEFAFNDLELRRLENGFFEGNTCSFKMQEKFGYKMEGIKREAYICMANGKLENECITGLLKNEWIRN